MNKGKLGKNAIFLIASYLIYTITALFAETFLVAYLLKNNKWQYNTSIIILYDN